jgi:hypothetical protein
MFAKQYEDQYLQYLVEKTVGADQEVLPGPKRHHQYFTEYGITVMTVFFGP